MTLELAMKILRLDDGCCDYDNDRLQAMIDILPHYIFERTGYPISKQADEPLCQLLEQFLIRKFYLPDEIYGTIDKTIESLLISLKFKAETANAPEVKGEFTAGHIPVFDSDGKLVDSGAGFMTNAGAEKLIEDLGI